MNEAWVMLELRMISGPALLAWLSAKRQFNIKISLHTHFTFSVATLSGQLFSLEQIPPEPMLFQTLVLRV